MRFFSFSEQFFLDREGVSVPNLCKVRLWNFYSLQFWSFSSKILCRLIRRTVFVVSSDHWTLEEEKAQEFFLHALLCFFFLKFLWSDSNSFVKFHLRNLSSFCEAFIFWISERFGSLCEKSGWELIAGAVKRERRQQDPISDFFSSEEDNNARKLNRFEFDDPICLYVFTIFLLFFFFEKKCERVILEAAVWVLNHVLWGWISSELQLWRENNEALHVAELHTGFVPNQRKRAIASRERRGKLKFRFHKNRIRLLFCQISAESKSREILILVVSPLVAVLPALVFSVSHLVRNLDV